MKVKREGAELKMIEPVLNIGQASYPGVFFRMQVPEEVPGYQESSLRYCWPE